jgi:hypothetical protein
MLLTLTGRQQMLITFASAVIICSVIYAYLIVGSTLAVADNLINKALTGAWNDSKRLILFMLLWPVIAPLMPLLVAFMMTDEWRDMDFWTER